MSERQWDKFELIPLLAILLLVGHVAWVAFKSDDDPPTGVTAEAAPNDDDTSGSVQTADRTTLEGTERL